MVENPKQRLQLRTGMEIIVFVQDKIRTYNEMKSTELEVNLFQQKAVLLVFKKHTFLSSNTKLGIFIRF